MAFDLGALWGAPGVQGLARDVVARSASEWGLPGELAGIIPMGKPTAPPAEAKTVAPSPVANTTKEDAQPEPGFMAKNGRLVMIGAAVLAVAAVIWSMFRRGR